jgi:uncharacterized protein (TIGR02646 family)
MIFIEKQPTAKAKSALSIFIAKEGKKAHYRNFAQSDNKGEVQQSLVSEQYYLCAYCMRRIHVAEKIEHWLSQESSKENSHNHETLDYDNMLAVCNGISVHKPDEYEHCDQSRSKSNRVLTVNPTIKTTIEQIKYLKNGTIYSDNSDIQKDLNDTKSLNLNNLRLLDNRQRTYKEVETIIKIRCKNKSEAMAKAEIKKIIDTWKNPKYTNERYELKEFCGIVLYFFKGYL